MVGAMLLLASAASAGGATRTYTAQYRGEYGLSYDGSDGLGDYSRIEQTFTWTERVYTEVTSRGRVTSTRTLRAQGTLTEDEQQGIRQMPPPPPTSLRCTATELKTGKPYLLGLTVAPAARPLRGVGVGALLPDDVGTQLTITGPPNCRPGGAVWLLSNPFSATYSNQFPPDAQTAIFNDAFGASAKSLPATRGVKRYDVEQTAKVMPYSSQPMTIVDISRSMHAVISTGPISNACSTAASATSAPARAARSMSCCPNPADDPLPGEATKRADNIFEREWSGNGLGHDGLSESALHEIKSFANRVKREYPLADGHDRAERKRLMNEEMRKLDNRLERLDAKAERDLKTAESEDIAHAKCPDAKKKIHNIYDDELNAITRDYTGDLKFIANEVVGAVNLFCGCHLSVDIQASALTLSARHRARGPRGSRVSRRLGPRQRTYSGRRRRADDLPTDHA
jgi:hypothetical protein